MTPLLYRKVSRDTNVRVQPGGMIEIWNELDDGSVSNVGIEYGEAYALITALNEMQAFIRERVRDEIVTVRYLLDRYYGCTSEGKLISVIKRRWGVTANIVKCMLIQMGDGLPYTEPCDVDLRQYPEIVQVMG